MKIFHVGSHQFRESLRELLRELWFPYCSSREMPFREWNFAFRESLSEFRETPRAPTMGLSLRELFSWNWGGPQASDYKIGASAHFCWKKVARPNFGCSHLSQVGHFYVATNLAQMITSTWPRKLRPMIVFFGAFFALKNVWKYLCLQCFLNINQNLPQNWPKKYNFHILQNTAYKKPSWSKIGVFFLK